MNVREIVIAHLKAGGFDGLAGEDCGCGLDDLMPCEEYRMADCKPAKRINCKDDGFTHCEGCFGECLPVEKETAYIFVTARQEQCGKVSDGNACTMPKGSECSDCCGIRGETIGAGD